MAKSFLGNVEYPLNFNVTKTAPLDDRLIVDEKSNLWDGSLGDYTYVGMVVNIMGTSDLWVLTSHPSTDEKNWKKVNDSDQNLNNNEILKLKNQIESTQKKLDDLLNNKVEFIDNMGEVIFTSVSCDEIIDNLNITKES